MGERNYATSADFEYLRKIEQETADYVTLVTDDLIDKVCWNKQCIKMMREDGRDLNLIYGNVTLLHRACKMEEDLVEFLLDNGADVNAEMRGGYTPLHVACTFEDCEELVRLLLHRGAIINKPDDKGVTPLDIACYFGSSEVLKMFKEKGAELNRQYVAKTVRKDTHELEILMKNKDYKKETKVDSTVPFYSESGEIAMTLKIGSNTSDESDEEDVVKELKKYSTSELKEMMIRELGSSELEEMIIRELGSKAILNACVIGNKRHVKEMLKKYTEITEVKDDFLINIINVSNNIIIKDLINIFGIERINKIFNSISEQKYDVIINAVFTRENILDKVTGELKKGIEEKITDDLKQSYKNGNKGYIRKLLATGIKESEIKEELKRNTYTSTVFMGVEEPQKNVKYDEKDLLIAIKSGDRNEINKCLRNPNVNVEVVDDKGKCALVYAIEKNDKETVMELLKKNASVNKVDKKEKTVLMYAIESNNVEFVEELRKRGARVNMLDKYGRNILMYALKKGESMSTLIDYMISNIINKANVNYTDKNETSMLMYACVGGYMPAVKRLVEIGSDINAVDINGNTAVGAALMKENIELAKYLIKEGAINLGYGEAQNKKANEFWKLFNEVQNGEREENKVIENINDNVEPVNVVNKSDDKKKFNKNKKGNLVEKTNITVLINAAKSNDLAKLIKLIKPSNVDERDDYGKTCLMYACDNGALKAAEYLIEEGASIDEYDKDGKTPLYYACDNNHKDIVEHLIKNGVTIRSEVPDRAFCTACSKGYLDIVKVLVENGMPVDPIYHVETPLMCACKNGQLEVVRYLVHNGADVNSKLERTGETVLDFARKSKDTNVVRYIENRIKNKSKVKDAVIPKERSLLRKNRYKNK